MDRILSAILVAVIAAIGICSLSDPSSGEGADIESDGIAYTLDDDGTATVSGYTGADGIVVIPQSVTHDGKEYAVRSIGDSAFKEAAGLTGIVIPDAVGKAVAEYRPIDEYSEWTEDDDDGADTWILAAIAGIVFVTIAAVWMFRRTKE